MKFFIAFVAVVSVALATPHRPAISQEAQMEAIIAAINSPSTDPSTAALLQQQLQQIIAEVTKPEPIAVGPELVDIYEPIAVDPALVDDFEQIAIGPTIIDDSIISAPATGSNVQASSPLVQIIVNVANSAAPQAPGTIQNPIFDGPTVPDTVNVVDNAPETVNVVDQAPEFVNVVDQAPEVISVVDQAPETVNVVQPIIPVPVINLPDTLN